LAAQADVQATAGPTVRGASSSHDLRMNRPARPSPSRLFYLRLYRRALAVAGAYGLSAVA
jgi:hypothetical protein